MNHPDHIHAIIIFISSAIGGILIIPADNNCHAEDLIIHPTDLGDVTIMLQYQGDIRKIT